MVGVHVAVLLHPASGFAERLAVHVVHQPHDIVPEGALHTGGAERGGAIKLLGQTIFALLVILSVNNVKLSLPFCCGHVR